MTWTGDDYYNSESYQRYKLKKLKQERKEKLKKLNVETKSK